MMIFTALQNLSRSINDTLPCSTLVSKLRNFTITPKKNLKQVESLILRQALSSAQWYKVYVNKLLCLQRDDTVHEQEACCLDAESGMEKVIVRGVVSAQEEASPSKLLENIPSHLVGHLCVVPREGRMVQIMLLHVCKKLEKQLDGLKNIVVVLLDGLLSAVTFSGKYRYSSILLNCIAK